MSILGIGIDLIEVERISGAMERHGDRFLERLFTKKEREYCGSYAESKRHFAGRFAAKEAIVKALGVGFGKEASWHDIEIVNDLKGKPVVNLLSDGIKELIGDAKVHVSISHSKENATAVAVIEV